MCKIYKVTEITISWYFLFPKYSEPLFHYVKYEKALQRKSIQRKLTQFVDSPYREMPYTIFETVDKVLLGSTMYKHKLFQVMYHFYYFKIIIVFSICYMTYTFSVLQTKI